MSVEANLLARCEARCELCSSSQSLSAFVVAPHTDLTIDHSVMLCDLCLSQLNDPQIIDINHWRCLNESMWSSVAPVQVLAWRQLAYLFKQGESWASDLLDMMYLEEDVKAWAKIGVDEEENKTLDSNGSVLQKGDDVIIIKDLPVKGTSQVIKRGTVVRNISLDDDLSLISGKVNSQSMFLIAKYCRKK